MTKKKNKAVAPEYPQPVLSVFSPCSLFILLSRLCVSMGWMHSFCKVFFWLFTLCPLALKFFRPKKAKKDVIVSTYMKSGTNLAIQTALEIAWKGQAPENHHIHDIVPWPDFADQRSMVSLSKAPLSPDTGFRIIKTHANHLPYRPDVLYVVVIRDPKEVVVSAFHFVFGFLGVRSKMSIDAWMEYCFDSFLYLWACHIAQHWPWRHRPNVLLKTYQQLVADKESATREMAEFMQVSLTEEEMQLVLDKSSFDYMKHHQGRFAPPVTVFTKEDEYPDMIRRGKVGQSDELLTASQQQAIDDYCRKTLLQLGSDFPYDEIFCHGGPPTSSRRNGKKSFVLERTRSLSTLKDD